MSVIKPSLDSHFGTNPPDDPWPDSAAQDGLGDLPPDLRRAYNLSAAYLRGVESIWVPVVASFAAGGLQEGRADAIGPDLARLRKAREVEGNTILGVAKELSLASDGVASLGCRSGASACRLARELAHWTLQPVDDQLQLESYSNKLAALVHLCWYALSGQMDCDRRRAKEFAAGKAVIEDHLDALERAIRTELAGPPQDVPRGRAGWQMRLAQLEGQFNRLHARMKREFRLAASKRPQWTPGYGAPDDGARAGGDGVAAGAGPGGIGGGAPEEGGNVLRLSGEVWTIRYCEEQGSYPAKGNQCVGWLATLLARPNRLLTVAELRGDPEGKLTADAQLGEEHETDWEAIKAIRKRMQEIEDINAATGGSDSLNDEYAKLLLQVQAAEGGKQFASRLKKDHHNVATQLRAFLRTLATTGMPKLAAHLTASLRLSCPHAGYYPPAGTPAWEI